MRQQVSALAILPHTGRVAKITAVIAKGYGVSRQEALRMEAAARLHDIGKLFIPRSILNKPGSLTDEEYHIIKRHPVLGAAYLANIPGVDPMAMAVACHHHERWTGHGYPGRLAGDKIPLVAQIVGLADCIEALSSERCYKAAIPPSEATNMVIAGECGAFSPTLIGVLMCPDVLRATTEVLRTKQLTVNCPNDKIYM